MIIRDVEAKLARARAIDRHCLLFGAAQHRYLLNPPLSEADVHRFEQQHGVQLPQQYREFVLTVGDGGAGPGYGLSRLSGCWIRGALRSPFLPASDANGIGAVDREPDGASASNRYDGCMAIGHQGCGVWYLLVVTGPHSNEVWEDLSVEDRGFSPTRRGYFEWYEGWLDGALADPRLGEHLETQWKRMNCLGFPRQCPRCYGFNIRTTTHETGDGEGIVLVTSLSSSATTRQERDTCLDCGLSVVRHVS
ncbi:MAG: SMI1/KNR4 family protein [Pirellulaceae bacterium]|nr:SMI1/KNR4 family protein [Pirellulaceae bacterium]